MIEKNSEGSIKHKGRITGLQDKEKQVTQCTLPRFDCDLVNSVILSTQCW